MPSVKEISAFVRQHVPGDVVAKMKVNEWNGVYAFANHFKVRIPDDALIVIVTCDPELHEQKYKLRDLKAWGVLIDISRISESLCWATFFTHKDFLPHFKTAFHSDAWVMVNRQMSEEDADALVSDLFDDEETDDDLNDVDSDDLDEDDTELDDEDDDCGDVDDSADNRESEDNADSIDEESGLNEKLVLKFGKHIQLGPSSFQPGMDLVLIKPGTFEMGSPFHDEVELALHDEKEHTVTITHPFYIGEIPVTQLQYRAVTGQSPSCFEDPTTSGNPVEQISWHDAVSFCRKLDALVKASLPDGMSVQLPTEAQWEYACRAGTSTRYFLGDEEDDLAQAGWYANNSRRKTHPVKRKAPNDFGLYDMHGNVYEWCKDTYREDYESLPEDDPCNLTQGAEHVARGGSWFDDSEGCRSAVRVSLPTGTRNPYIGFRVVVALSSNAVKLPSTP